MSRRPKPVLPVWQISKRLTKAAGIVASLTILLTGGLSLDSRYAKAGDIQELKRQNLKLERRLLDKERYDIIVEEERLRQKRQPLPPYAQERLRTIERDIKDLDTELRK